MATAPAPATKRTVRAVNRGAAVTPRVAPSRRAPTYSMDRYGSMPRTGAYFNGDLTIKKEAKVAVVRPAYYKKPLIFRMMPALSPDDTIQFAPYRDPETGAYSDLLRCYPAVRYTGVTKQQQITFLLYNQETPNYDPRTNPYCMLYDRVWRAVKQDTHLPRFRGVLPDDWRWYIEKHDGKMPFLTKPTWVYFCQGIVFSNADKKYFGKDVSPRGLGARDLLPLIQLPASAGGGLWDLMQEVNEGFAGVQSDNFEESMVHGDLVDPRFGRFITVAGKQGAGSAGGEEDDGYAIGKGGGNDSDRKSSFQGEGYTVSISRQLTYDGRTYKMSPALPEAAMKILKPRIVWYDDILYFPGHEEICVLLAQAFKQMPHILRLGWEENPEFFSDEVEGILKSAKTLPSGAIPTDADAEPSDDNAEMYVGGESGGEVPVERLPRTRSQVVPNDELVGGENDMSGEAEHNVDTIAVETVPGGIDDAEYAEYIDDEYEQFHEEPGDDVMQNELPEGDAVPVAGDAEPSTEEATTSDDVDTSMKAAMAAAERRSAKRGGNVVAAAATTKAGRR